MSKKILLDKINVPGIKTYEVYRKEGGYASVEKAIKTLTPDEVVEEVKTHFQDMVFDTIIQRNTKLGEAPSFGETIIMHDATSKGAINYLNLAREILQNNELTKMSASEKVLTEKVLDNLRVSEN